MDYSYKNQQLILVSATNIDQAQIYVNSICPVDKIRITIFDSLNINEFKPGILVWSSIVNNYIGTCCLDYTDTVNNVDYFDKTLKPLNGIEYFFTNKMILNGFYSVKFTDLVNNSPASYLEGQIFILIEYFIL